MVDRRQADGPGPPPRPRWVKVLLVVALAVLVLAAIIALAGGEHGPGRHAQGGGSAMHTLAI
jgi:hypothetical protein